MDTPTHKLVNGERIPLTDAEVQALLAEWTANDAAVAAKKAADDAKTARKSALLVKLKDKTAKLDEVAEAVALLMEG